MPELVARLGLYRLKRRLNLYIALNIIGVPCSIAFGFLAGLPLPDVLIVSTILPFRNIMVVLDLAIIGSGLASTTAPVRTFFHAVAALFFLLAYATTAPEEVYVAIMVSLWASEIIYLGKRLNWGEVGVSANEIVGKNRPADGVNFEVGGAVSAIAGFTITGLPILLLLQLQQQSLASFFAVAMQIINLSLIPLTSTIGSAYRILDSSIKSFLRFKRRDDLINALIYRYVIGLLMAVLSVAVFGLAKDLHSVWAAIIFSGLLYTSFTITSIVAYLQRRNGRELVGYSAMTTCIIFSLGFKSELLISSIQDFLYIYSVFFGILYPFMTVIHWFQICRKAT